MVARGVDARLEPGRGRAREKPGARLQMGVAERRPAHATVGCGAYRRELVEIRSQTIGVDTDRRAGCA